MFCSESMCKKVYSHLETAQKDMDIEEARDYDTKCHRCYLEGVILGSFGTQAFLTSELARDVYINVKKRTPAQ